MLLFCRRALFLALLTTLAAGAHTQSSIYSVVYRPPSAAYRVLESPHFDLIFQEGAEADAQRTAAVLEEALPSTRRLVGLQENQRLRMPVVLNAFNDRSNGFVRALPFKQEIERTGIKGNRLGTRTSSWLAAVAPHELTHAAHAEVNAAPGWAGSSGRLRRTRAACSTSPPRQG